jgi:hypothetical protein
MWVLLSCGLASVVTIGVIGVLLVSLQRDARYVAHRPDVYDLVGKLNLQVRSEDVMVIDNAEFTTMLMFMNWFKPGTYYITLSDQPDSDAITNYALNWASTNFERLWFVTQNSRLLPFEDRQMEYQLTSSLYYALEIDQGDEARALLFATAPGINDTTTIEIPATATESLLLRSVTLSTTMHVGDLFPLTLHWSLAKPLALDVCISLQLYGNDGTIVAQQDNRPQGNFGLTSEWQMGQVYDDRHALMLPLKSDIYHLRVVVYECQGDAIDTIAIGDFQVE